MLDVTNPIWKRLPTDVRRAVLDVVMSMAANDEVALFTYEGKPRVLLPLVPTPEQRERLERVGFSDRHAPSAKRAFLYAPKT